jgi:hypothetical protein
MLFMSQSTLLSTLVFKNVVTTKKQKGKNNNSKNKTKNVPVMLFMSRSTLLSTPVFSSVVIASVAIDRLASVIRFSRSVEEVVTGVKVCLCVIHFAQCALQQQNITAHKTTSHNVTHYANNSKQNNIT